MLLRFSISTILLTVTTIQTRQTEGNNKIIRANTYQSFNNRRNITFTKQNNSLINETTSSGIVMNEKVQPEVGADQTLEHCEEELSELVKNQQPMQCRSVMMMVTRVN